jgi:hypothetical protein
VVGGALGLVEKMHAAAVGVGVINLTRARRAEAGSPTRLSSMRPVTRATDPLEVGCSSAQGAPLGLAAAATVGATWWLLCAAVGSHDCGGMEEIAAWRARPACAPRWA